MEDFKSRLEEEINQLDKKLSSLNDFINSDKIKNINKHQSTLLIIQAKTMDTYLSILSERWELLE